MPKKLRNISLERLTVYVLEALERGDFDQAMVAGEALRTDMKTLACCYGINSEPSDFALDYERAYVNLAAEQARLRGQGGPMSDGEPGELVQRMAPSQPVDADLASLARDVLALRAELREFRAALRAAGVIADREAEVADALERKGITTSFWDGLDR